MMKNDSDLFFACSLIEYIGRRCKLKRNQVVDCLGEDVLKRIYRYAGTMHCEPMEKVADDFITMCDIPEGDFDNVSTCRYEVPDYWTIGEVYERLIEDVSEPMETVATMIEVYHSWINDVISNYNSDFFYQSREYISVCYEAGEVL